MDSNPGPGPGPSRAQSQRSLRAPSSRASILSLPGPATPAESDGPADEYFEPLSSAASRRSRLSTASYGRPGSVAASETNAAERSRRPSIRIRRSSVGSTTQPASSTQDVTTTTQTRDSRSDGARGNRPRSISQPGPAPPMVGDAGAGAGRARNSRRVQPQIALPRLTEEGSRPTMAELGLEGTSPLSPSMSMPPAPVLVRSHSDGEAGVDEDENKKQTRRRSLVGRLFRPNSRRASVLAPAPEDRVVISRDEDEYNEELVDWLDIIDPEVQTLSTLTNVQNSLFIPDLGSWVNRRPTYVLSQHDPPLLSRPASARDPLPPPEEPTIPEDIQEEARQEEEEGEATDHPPYIRRSDTITSRLSDSHYAALPHGRTLEGWSPSEKWELDDHVRHMLHSRRAKFKRQMKGFGQYVRRPLGFFVTLYATLITLFGLAWVLFLIGWIYVGEQQVYAIHIIDSVLVALFAVMGDGLAPFRAVDTYHMIFIARYSRKIAKAKKKAAKELEQTSSKPQVQTSDTPSPEKSTTTPPAEEATAPYSLTPPPPTNTGIPPITLDGDNNPEIDLEDAKSESFSLDYDYLTPKQRKSLEHHQKKLSKSHSFYKPHETFTHHAFPLGHLMAIIILLDCHSCLQISLGATTWGIDYHHRPFAITTVILCVSITCNLTAGLVIMFGDKKTRKKDVVELLERQSLTGDAIKKLEKKKKKEDGKNENVDMDLDRGVANGETDELTVQEGGDEKGKDKEVDDMSGTKSSGHLFARAANGTGSAST